MTSDPTGTAHKTRVALRLAVDQGGVVRRDQLIDHGWSPRTLSRRIASGQWETSGRKVLILAGTDQGLLRDSLVVAQRVYPRGALTGFSALAVRGALEREADRVPLDPIPWLRLPEHARVGARVVRRPGGPGVGEMLGVPVVTVPEALADLMRLLPETDARELVLHQARRRGSGFVANLISEQLADDGAGVPQLRRLLQLVSSGAQSQAEELLVQLLVDAGVSGFIANYPVVCARRSYRIDVAFPAARLAVEVDGQAFHTDARSFQGDRARQNDLIAAGWRVLRFTWRDLTTRPESVLRDIAGFLV